jgi:hypothetical protein
MVEVLDELAMFEEYRATMLPKLRDQIDKGASTKEILGTAKAAAVARLASLAVLEQDSKVAITAIKELLDRLDGRVTDRKEITHQMANLKSEELDALVLTALNEGLEEDDEGN